MVSKNKVEEVNKIVESMRSELTQLSLDIYNNPELGMEEFKACKWQTELLEKHGFQVEDGFCGIKTAFKAVYKGEKSGPKIAFLAEYDALPKLGHGCGHNLIAMVSNGSGIALKNFVDEYGGEVYVIGTPAEETAGAKVSMAKLGAFDDMDVVMMAHPGYGNVDSLDTMAMTSRKVEFFGKTAHAAASPEAGINALDAMINFFNLINAMRQQTKQDARLHGVITDGGEAANIIPDYTSAYFYIRSDRVADVKVLTDKFAKCAEGAALGTGCTVKITPIEEDFMDTHSNQVLNNLACDCVEMFTKEPIVRMNGERIAGSSDLGDVSYKCPAIQLVFKIGEGETVMGQHTPKFAECSGSQEGIDNGLDFIKGFALAGIEILANPEVLAKIKEEHSQM